MIPDIATRPLSEIPLVEICAALDAGYEGYVVPVRFEPSALTRRMLAEHVDLTLSHLILAPDGGAAGVQLVARRGATSRIAALGIVPDRRGAGLGAAAIRLAVAQAQARGDRRMVLEVISTNEAAMSTYRKAGFVARRGLCGYARAAAGPTATDAAHPCEVAEVMPLIAAAWPQDASWQTSPLALAAAAAPVEALRDANGSAAALVDASGDTARLLALAVDPAAQRQGVGRRFLDAVGARYPGKAFAITATLPESQAHAFLAATGWQRTPISQIEMELTLA